MLVGVLCVVSAVVCSVNLRVGSQLGQPETDMSGSSHSCGLLKLVKQQDSQSGRGVGFEAIACVCCGMCGIKPNPKIETSEAKSTLLLRTTVTCALSSTRHRVFTH